MLINMDIDGDVAILKMDNGPGNRFNREFLDEFNWIMDEYESGQKARALVVTNADGNYFTEGMDIGWVMELDESAIREFFLHLFRFLNRLFIYPLPVVAAMNGHSVASGLAFAMCADYRIMRRDEAVCSFPEVDLHIQPPPGCMDMVIHSIGRHRTELAFFSGLPYRGEQALAMGFADELADADKVLERAVEVATGLGSKPLETYTAIKRSIRGNAAELMLERDEAYIGGSEMISMFQSCDLECLKSLSG